MKEKIKQLDLSVFKIIHLCALLCLVSSFIIFGGVLFVKVTIALCGLFLNVIGAGIIFLIGYLIEEVSDTKDN